MSEEIERAKYEFAIMTILLDISDDIIVNNNFSQETKYRANMARKSIKNLLSFAYGSQSMEEFDEAKEKIFEYAYKQVQGNFHLKDE